MRGRSVREIAGVTIAQERLARPHRLEDAAFALDAVVAGEADGLGDEAHHRFGDVDVEVVHDQMSVRGGVAAGASSRRATWRNPPWCGSVRVDR